MKNKTWFRVFGYKPTHVDRSINNAFQSTTLKQSFQADFVTTLQIVSRLYFQIFMTIDYSIDEDLQTQSRICLCTEKYNLIYLAGWLCLKKQNFKVTGKKLRQRSLVYDVYASFEVKNL